MKTRAVRKTPVAGGARSRPPGTWNALAAMVNDREQVVDAVFAAA
jgi:hypothetical protein